jgi:hypothetical protein
MGNWQIAITLGMAPQSFIFPSELQANRSVCDSRLGATEGSLCSCAIYCYQTYST